MSRFSKSITIMILLITFQSSVVASGKEYYENLVSNWSKIFPDQNRNAAGPVSYTHLTLPTNDQV